MKYFLAFVAISSLLVCPLVALAHIRERTLARIRRAKGGAGWLASSIVLCVLFLYYRVTYEADHG
jgi:hypothetical protein